MADGFSMKVPGLQKSMARLKRIAPNADEELEKANGKTAQEFVGLARSAAPRRTGELAESVKAKRVEERGMSGWGIYALWRWIFAEFGTVKQSATPFLFPVYRLIRKRHVGRTKRAVNKAIKRALSR